MILREGGAIGESCTGTLPVVYLGCPLHWEVMGRKERLLGKPNARCRDVARWLGLFGLLLLLVGCGRSTEPTPVPTPDEPTPAPTPTPDDLIRYIMATERYTSYGAVIYVNDMSAGEVARVLRAMQAIEPPEELEALHEQALEAYREICNGKLLLPGAESELRAEAYFI